MSVFEEIKVGDTIVIDPGGRGFERVQSLLIIAPVTKVTKTQLTANGIRFNRRNGREHGGSSWAGRAEIESVWKSGEGGRLMTPEEAEAKNRETRRELNHKALALAIRAVSFAQLPYETLVELAKILGMEVPDDQT